MCAVFPCVTAGFQHHGPLHRDCWIKDHEGRCEAGLLGWEGAGGGGCELRDVSLSGVGIAGGSPRMMHFHSSSTAAGH